jgi:hypothetical protein
MTLKFPHDFHHQAPKGYSYEIELFKRNIFSIWICNHGEFSYTDKTPRSIWGFYDTKKGCYYAPINASKSGDQVDIKDTTPYSAMQLKLNPLENVLYSTC